MTIPVLLSLLLSVNVPEGFQVDVFAKGLEGPHAILALDDGTVLVTRPAMNDVIALRDTNNDGIADQMRTAIASVEGAQSLVMKGRTLYIAGTSRIVAANRLPDGSFGEPRDIVEKLPAGGRRALAIGGDGKLYVAVGSACADCVETHPEHATLLQFDPDGLNRRIFARGLGDTAAIDANPRTGDLWSANGGELNRLGDGLHYGWPFCTGKQPAANAVAPEGMTKEKFCRSSEAAALELPARASGFAFYRGAQFPDAFRHDAFSASGAKVLRVKFENDKPVAAEEFASGANDIEGLTASADGALLFSDEAAGTIYRVTYGAMPRPMTSSSEEIELAATPVLSKAFRIADLHGPASVVHDEEQDVYFVSNVDGTDAGKDGKGFISRITPNGKVADAKFIDGLDAPKGMAIRGRELWVADIDVVRVFDRMTGAPLRKIEMASHGAVYLEDVAVGPDDAIYVTDMDVRIRGEKERLRQGDGRIYRIGESDDVEVAMAGEELRSPSGIAWDGTRFLIAQSYGNEVLAWNRGMGTKAVLRGPGAYDGIAVLPNGTVIVSSHYDDALHFGKTGELRPLFARKPSPGGIAFDRKRNRLLIPSPDGDWLEAWTLPPLDQQPTKTAKEGVTEVAKTDPPHVP
ncbi:MAG TPA: PQQ-dependent sugar dehydrogenase [Thermoanaerobaculia bacterium]|jgi:glucose/arabinose dehydrogenase